MDIIEHNFEMDHRSPNRNFTVGEIGCTLSHIKCYETFMSEDIDFCVILEDDVIIPEYFDEKITNIIQNLKNIDWEFLYLGRNKVDFGKPDEEYDDNFVKAGYSWWCCGYMLNKKGAEKILSSNILNKLTVIDEFIPIISGCYYHQFFDAYGLQEYLKIYSLKNLIIHPKPNAFDSSETEFSKTIDTYWDGLTVIGVATSKTDGLKRFEDSCKFHGLKYELIGMDQEWKGGDMRLGGGGGMKINLLKSHINIRCDEEIILVTDTYDVVFCNNPVNILKKFNEHETEILFSAETECWPDNQLKTKYPSSNSKYKYLNSGGFIGKVKHVKKMLLKNLKDEEDDQLYYTKEFLFNKDLKIKLDYDCTIFQTTDYNDLSIDFKFIYNKTTNTHPCHFHGNGGLREKDVFNSLSDYANWDEYYGYNVKDNILNLPKELHILVYIEKTDELIQSGFLKTINENINNLRKRTNVGVMFYSNFEFNNLHSIKKGTNEDDKNFILEISKKFDYLWMISDNFQFTSNEVLYNLIYFNKDIIGPLLIYKNKRIFYSNYYRMISHEGLPEKSWDYYDILKMEKKGCWNVPYIAGNVLIKQNKIHEIQNFFSDLHENNFNDSDLNFCFNCRKNGIFMYVLNNQIYNDNFDFTFQKQRENKFLNCLIQYDISSGCFFEHYMNKIEANHSFKTMLIFNNLNKNYENIGFLLEFAKVLHIKVMIVCSSIEWIVLYNKLGYKFDVHREYDNNIKKVHFDLKIILNDDENVPFCINNNTFFIEQYPLVECNKDAETKKKIQIRKEILIENSTFVYPVYHILNVENKKKYINENFIRIITCIYHKDLNRIIEVLRCFKNNEVEIKIYILIIDVEDCDIDNYEIDNMNIFFKYSLDRKFLLFFESDFVYIPNTISNIETHNMAILGLNTLCKIIMAKKIKVHYDFYSAHIWDEVLHNEFLEKPDIVCIYKELCELIIDRDMVLLNYFENYFKASIYNIDECLTWEKNFFKKDFLDVINDFDNNVVLKYNEVCNDAYQFSFLNEKFCSELINIAEEYGWWSDGVFQKENFIDKRLGNIEKVPTIDVNMEQLKLDKVWESIVMKYIKKVVFNIYQHTTVKINTAFIVKYEMGKQEYLKPHFDNGVYTLIIPLNDDFEGGGTAFTHKTFKPKKGEAIIFPSNWCYLHQGNPVTSGTKRVIVTWYYVDSRI